MTDLETLTAEDLLAAIVPPDDSEEPSFDLGDLKTNLLKELNRRVGDPELVKEIPGTGLIQLVKELLRQPDEPKAAEAEGLDILDSLAAVPVEHARMVLDREIERREVDLERFRAKREEYA